MRTGKSDLRRGEAEPSFQVFPRAELESSSIFSEALHNKYSYFKYNNVVPAYYIQ